MKRKLTTNMLLTSAVSLLPMLLGIAVYSRLPEQLPSHWSFSGEVNGYSGKATIVFILPILMAVLSVFVQFMLENDPKKANMSSALKAISRWCCPLLSLVLVPMTIFVGLGYDVPISLIVCVIVGFVFIAVGNYLPKSKLNYTMGIRLPWTLSSEENWNRTHRFAGKVWMVAGFLLIICGFAAHQLHSGMTAVAVLLLLALFSPTVYSFWLYKKGI